jgi:tRNA nucleotidyltransferase (CCA-adding enzyme)
MAVEIYMVGGAVRDKLLNVRTKDVDFSVVAESWDELIAWLDDNGFTRFVTTPEYLTVRAHFPKDWTFNGEDVSRLTADFVLAREDGQYGDGRRPDEVKMGTLAQDLARRDYTINALAMDKDGNIIDLFEGRKHLEQKILTAVGNAEDRIREDALRALRAIRFEITKGLSIDHNLWDVLAADWLPALIAQISVERRREELLKCFKHDSKQTLEMLYLLGPHFFDACFSDGLWLEPSLKDV